MKIKLKYYLVTAVAILCFGVLGVIVYFGIQANKPAADNLGSDGIYYLRVNSDTGSTPVNVMQTGPFRSPAPTRWWQLINARQAGSVNWGELDSENFGGTWQKVASIYPHYNTQNADIILDLCASDDIHEVQRIIPPSDSPICKRYNFNSLDGKPYTFQFLPAGSEAVGRYASARLLIMTNNTNLLPKIPTTMTFFVNVPPYAGLSSFETSDITFEDVQEGQVVSLPQAMPQAAAALRAMAKEYKAATGQNLYIKSGMRPTASQEYMYKHPDQYPDAAPPCTSWHEAGLSVDFDIEKMDQDRYEGFFRQLLVEYRYTIEDFGWHEPLRDHAEFLLGVWHFSDDVIKAINAAGGGTICPR